jgi:3-phosphoshikimate 1-carboxyvinyltransferase
MNIKLQLNGAVKSGHVTITGSKSETNRLLLLQALYPGIIINNISESDDSIAMQTALANTGDVIDIHHAGTAMRFLTAYFALQNGREITLTGSQRMTERPIGVLVDALRSIGAQIEYVGNEGYPPLKITGKKLTANKVAINAGVSSQYITALLLIAGKLENGLEILLEGELTSIPYIKMTLALLTDVGIENSFDGNVIKVKPATGKQLATTITVESDWSSASYFYSIVALSSVGTQIVLSSYKANSLQGDSALANIYGKLGVQTIFNENSITLTRLDFNPETFKAELNNTPDIAQTIAVTCFGLAIGCHLTGLHTLKIKETDRLEALKTELNKFGAAISVTNESLTLQARFNPPAEAVAVDTYNDHRMAMAFAPLAIKTPVIINDAGVVSKSFPTYWDDLQTLNFSVNTL